VLAKFIMQIHD